MRTGKKEFKITAVILAAAMLMCSCGKSISDSKSVTNGEHVTATSGDASAADKTAKAEFGDGEIKGKESGLFGEFGAETSGDTVYYESAADYSTSLKDVESDSEYDGGYDDYVDDDYINSIAAGMLTGGELRDLLNWDNYLRSFDSDVLSPWKVLSDSRVVIHVHNGESSILGVKVALTANGKEVYSAVSDINGNAYLFTGLDGQAQAPDGVRVYKADGSYDEYKLSEIANSKNEGEVEVENVNKDVNVDLMFVVDTTGSMGDELDYLKAEIQDVIERAEDETGKSIRTSVNFYRDQEDEYLVRYFDFRDDAKEVSKIVGEQFASGGGDFPEAVYEAFDNALNEHNWNEDSIKLMFVVLDAPPHDEDAKELAELVVQAAAMGVRIIPVMSSGADAETEAIFRSYAVLTGGTYLFLDDNSGIGYSHETPANSTDYDSELLNEMMIRVIGEFCGEDLGTVVVEPTPAPVQGN
ncbi:MAG: VWA domain-containing protein [Lachnospiraceae bacterium]|nr:VWA domain-containing protein [Lachnospiraceae bacterium]